MFGESKKIPTTTGIALLLMVFAAVIVVGSLFYRDFILY